MWLCIQIHMAVNPSAGGRVSMCPWLCIHVVMCPCARAGFGYAQWASAHCLIMHYGPVKTKSLTIAQNHTKFNQKFSAFFKETVRQKRYMFKLYYSRPKLLVQKKIVSVLWATAQNEIEFNYGRIRSKIKIKIQNTDRSTNQDYLFFFRFMIQ